MNPAVILLIVAGVLSFIGITMIIWPRRWALFAQLGMYEETPTPSAWNVGSIRVSGVIVVFGSLALIATGSALLSPQAATDSNTSDPVDQRFVDAEALGDRCRSVLPILDGAVLTDETGRISNVEQLELLAEQYDVGVRPPAGDIDDGTVLIVTIDGYAAFAIPDPPAGACGTFVLRLLE